MLSHERRFVAATRVGLVWGLGHTLTVLIVSVDYSVQIGDSDQGGTRHGIRCRIGADFTWYRIGGASLPAVLRQ